MSDPPHPTLFGLRFTLDEVGVPRPPVEADYALGRLAALMVAGMTGSRPARRMLAREREALIRRCFPAGLPLVDGGE